MNVIKYLLFIVCVTSNFLLFSQNGYMGKKLTVKYGFSLYTCAVYNLYYQVQETSPGLLLFKSTKAVRRVLLAQHLDIGYSLSRQWEITAQASIRPINYTALNDDYSTNTERPQFTKIPVLETSLDICARKYIRGANAPVGGYFFFGLGKSSAKSSIKEDSLHFINNYADQPDRTIPTYNSTWNAYRINYGMGIKKTINNKYFYEVEGLLVIPILQRNSNNSYGSSTPISQSIAYMNYTIRQQFDDYQAFYAKIGVGAFIGKSSRLPKKS